MDKKLLIFISILIAVIFFFLGSTLNQPVKETSLVGYFTELPPDIDELLEKTYGRSPYFTTIDNVKISVEKLINEKYFIVYSWTTGDQSYFAINLIIEDLNMKNLNKEDFEYLYIKDDKGKTYFPLPYYRLIDFPPDQPLGWKQILYVKFTPLNSDAEFIDLYITYRGEEKVIRNVPLD